MNSATHTRPVAVVAAIAVIIGSAIVAAGPLDPPSGAITGTLKTLSEVEPRVAINATNTPGDPDSLFKIKQPGSYYLTGNITGVVGKHGIEIVASGVTLDLNGFDLVGVPGMGGYAGVVLSVPDQANISVLNGSVRKWGGGGVRIAASGTTNCRVARVSVTANTGAGIEVAYSSLVSECSASKNTGVGITAYPGGRITDCTVDSNTSYGIYAGYGTVVSGCSVSNNTLGIYADGGATITMCSLFQNTQQGIFGGGSCTVVGCTVIFSTLDGINCAAGGSVIRDNNCIANGFNGDGAGIVAGGTGNLIEGNHCTSADRGIQVLTNRNTIVRNTCSGNTTDWVFVQNNVYGPILDRRAPMSGAVNGFSAPDAMGSTHPNANFSH